MKNLKLLKEKNYKIFNKIKKKIFTYVWKWTVCLVWIMLKRSRILNLCHVIKLLVRGIWVLINCECTTSESWYYSKLYFVLQAVLTWRISSLRETSLMPNTIFQVTNYILHKTRYLQIKHKTKFISLQAAKVHSSAYYESYFAELH